MIPISIASLFGDLRINGGLIRYIAQYRTEERTGDIKALIQTGLQINTIAGLILFLIIFLASGVLADGVLHQPEIQPLIQLASANLIAQSLIATSRAIFV